MEVVNIFPSFEELRYIYVTADSTEKRDRSAPSEYHWKILKCRMVIFSEKNIIAAPDPKEVLIINIVFKYNKHDTQTLMNLLHKFNLKQVGDINAVSNEIYKTCLQYTMTARVAPAWNYLGLEYLVNNRNFLLEFGQQTGLFYKIECSGQEGIKIKLRAVNLIFMKNDTQPTIGETVFVLPSLKSAIVQDFSEVMPDSAKFKCYKDLRRHWKNVHGYRLPEEPDKYYLLQFWRGEPLTYPSYCVRHMQPMIKPALPSEGKTIINKFLSEIRPKMAYFLGEYINNPWAETSLTTEAHDNQNISLCTPTQHQ